MKKDEKVQTRLRYLGLIILVICILFVSDKTVIKAEEADMVIKTVDELNAFAESVNAGNDYEGKIIKLGADIKYDGTTINNFTPIGNGEGWFSGTFDGAGYTISGIIVEGERFTGLFGRVEGEVTIKNVILDNCKFSGMGFVGGICGYVGPRYDTEIVNCVNKNGRVELVGDWGGTIGGIVGYCDGIKIKNCYTSGKISVIADGSSWIDVAGIANFAEEICNSYNEAAIDVKLYGVNKDNGAGVRIGGITSWGHTIENCYNTGKISVKGASGSIVGSVAGGVYETAINCYSSKDSYSKAFGYSDTSTKNCKLYSRSYMQTSEFRNLLNKNRETHKDWFGWEFRSGESKYPILEKVVRMNKCTIKVSTSDYAYNKKNIKPKVTVIYAGKKLKNGTDFKVTYSNNKYIGKAKIKIVGQRNYVGSVTKKFNIIAKKGTSFNVSGNKYTITSSSTVKFSGVTNSNTNNVVIPKTVCIGKKNFKVTEIADKALKGKRKVTMVTIGDNVKKIGKEAFSGCSKLSKITIKSTNLKSVGANALKGIKSTAKITVPSKKYKAYKALLKNKGQSSKVKIVKL